MTKTFKLTPNLIKKMYAFGVSAEGIRKILNLTEDEFDELFKDEKYVYAADAGREIADFNMIDAMYKKGTGYQHEDVHFYSFNGKLFKEKFVKHYPPDMTAIIFWLKNRRPKEWKEKIEGNGTLDEETMTALQQIAYERMCKYF